MVVKSLRKEFRTKDILSNYSKEASQLEINESDMIANTGLTSRTPFNNPEVKGDNRVNLEQPFRFFKSL